MEKNLWFWALGLTGWLLGRGKGKAGQPDAAVAAVRQEPRLPGSYSPKNVGNDASARPWEQQAEEGVETLENRSGSAMPGSLMGFDVETFLASSKDHFIQLQAAWDCGDIAALRVMMTPDMLAQIQPQLFQREQQAVPGSSQSEVVKLEAKLLGVEEQADGYLASVEFSGLIRDEPAAGPNPFRELWTISRSKDGGDGWLVAGVQALQ